MYTCLLTCTTALKEKGELEEPPQQSVRAREGELVSSAKDSLVPNSQGKGSAYGHQSSTPHSPKKGDADHPVIRRRKSSESLSEPYTGSRVITFNTKGEHTVHCGRCLGKSVI